MKLIDKIAPTLTNTADYPSNFRGVVGQAKAKELLEVTAASARVRKEPMQHVLFAYPTPGQGKTALGHATIGTLRRPARMYSGPMKVDLARLIFSEMRDGDVLFYDEFHRVITGGKDSADWLLTWMQDGLLSGPGGVEETPKITLIAATTEIGKLPPALVDRFLRPPMSDYTREEAAKIVTVLSGRILTGPKVTGKDALAIADAAGGNPRQIRNHLYLLRDMVAAKRMPDGYDIPGLLAFQGLDPDGLDERARMYLQVLSQEFLGQAGGAPLADRLGDVTDIERLLVGKGYVARTRAGRVLTRAGIRRCQDLEVA